MFTSSSCAEPDLTHGEQAYSAGTTYAIGAQVVVASEHRVYESLVAGNIGNTPISSPVQWLDIGPSNKWKMMDLLRNTQTVFGTPLVVVITPGRRIDSIALFGLDADTVTITLTSSAVVVYSVTIDLNRRYVADWYSYFFKEFSTIPNVARFDLPPYTNAVITITISRAAGDVSCGGVVIGSQQSLGATQYNAISDALNFSTVERDAFGNSTLVPRRSVPKTNQTCFVDKLFVNDIKDVRTALNAVPAVWAGLDDETNDYYDALFILGIYKVFTINLEQPTTAMITLELEEV
jgi:hypothetical protein